jgi:hypothetical protein
MVTAGNAGLGVAAASDAGSPSVVRLNPALDVGKLVVKKRLNPHRTVSTVVGFSVAVALACVASILRNSRLCPGDATLPKGGSVRLSGLLVNVGCRSAEPGAELLVAFERVLVAAVRIPAREVEIGRSVVGVDALGSG